MSLQCLHLFFLKTTFREREMELYGPKKRGPKPKTFLLKVRKTSTKSHGVLFCFLVSVVIIIKHATFFLN